MSTVYVLLSLAPLLLLVALLLLGCYPGERALTRALVRGRRRTRRRHRSLPCLPRRARRLPRGGLLLASRLASRGPPSHGLCTGS